ncbi:hypothetical protein [Streptomyces purpureus]|uniref:Low molecular weight antigen MTB12-like C-terminal domain-containing protein n=1 Tax=Streptomyces purpureus TaxID=1951 RepID=A0A918H7X2_9ACTN|nr:hypothetical protein [Streptomyces purpureus]GGT41009.1 hypothetical protein GCM10014713_38390 [Streptomyces purpureus]
MGLSRRDGHPRRRIAALAAAAVLVVTPAAVACGDNGGGTESNRSPAVTQPSPPATDGGRTAGPADPAAARAEIEKNWTTFFDPEASTDDKVEVLENGERMRSVLEAMAGDPAASQTSAKITDVAFTSATEANVTYDLLVGGTPTLPDSKGTAVLQDDTWKVSVKTLCGLVKLSGNAVPGC